MTEVGHKCTYENCSATFKRPYRLKLHLLAHENIKAFKCEEANCNKAYTSKSHLDRHIKTVHNVITDVSIFSCPDCLKTFSNLSNLKKHIRVLHSKDKIVFTCDNCHLDFRKKHQLTTHMYQHTGVKAFSCEMCEKNFITLHEKKRHMRCHKTYKCPMCSEVFELWSAYQKHNKSRHAVQEYVCDHCTRKFKQRSHILHHMKFHHTNVTISYGCPYDGCTKKYSRKNNLKQHIRTRHDKIKYNCTICSSKLSSKKQLAYHTKLHNVTTPTVIEPKTKLTGRKVRKDKGILKSSTAIKIAGFAEEKIEESDNLCSTVNISLQNQATMERVC